MSRMMVYGQVFNSLWCISGSVTQRPEDGFFVFGILDRVFFESLVDHRVQVIRQRLIDLGEKWEQKKKKKKRK
jgi:hypothetical protein